MDWAEKPDYGIASKNGLAVILLAGAKPSKSVIQRYGMDQTVLRSYAAFRVGDAPASEAFTAFLFDRVSVHARQLAFRKLASKIDVTDLLGDTFFQASKCVQQREMLSATELDKYFIGIMGNSLRSLSRHHIMRDMEVKVRSDILEKVATDVDVEKRVILKDLIEKCRQGLRSDERMLFELILKERTIGEMAERLDLSLTTVSQKRRRLLTKLRKFIESN